MDLKNMNQKLHTLAIFAGIRRDPVIAALEQMTAAGDDEAFVERYCAFAAALYERDTNWSRYLHALVMEDDNICVRRAAVRNAGGRQVSDPGFKGILQDEVLAESLDRELAILQELSLMSNDDLTRGRFSCQLPGWEISEYDFAGDYAKHLEELPRKGYGIFARHHVFRVEDGELAPVLTPDPQRLSDLVGYEAQREPVIANTKAFLQGLPANNVLLYGDAGTGKSSTVKAIVNEYRDEGLRLIEIKQPQLAQIPVILESLAGNPLHFILFIDDLSFEAGNREFIALKNILEGGASDTRGNALIYATSNRRHFVKEDAASRAGSDMFRNDTIQETMSLAARFGLTVTFQKPAKDLYLQIVEALAERSGIEMERQDLFTEAEAFAIRASGRSPRTARQFVDTLNIRQHIT